MAYSVAFSQNKIKTITAFSAGKNKGKSTLKNNDTKPVISTVYHPSYGYSDEVRLAAVSLCATYPFTLVAEVFGVHLSTIYRWVDALGVPAQWKTAEVRGQASVKPLRDRNGYTQENRVIICKFAMTYGISSASKLFGASVSSIYNWLKTYNMQTAYFNK